jgi:DNA-directed RNA polymerase beta subunit
MVGSKWCRMSEATTIDQRVAMDECPYNQGGYFIVNGSEKLIQAQ